MMHSIIQINEFNHMIIKKYATKNSITVDTTAGNGNDTLLLASLAKHVYSFDIQKAAIEATKRITSNYHNIDYILDSHENIDKYVKEADLIIYNLGYLPNFDKNITTLHTSTINSLKKSINLLNKNGIIILTVYTGHDEGKKEEQEIIKFISNLEKKYEISKYSFKNKNDAPYSYLIGRNFL